MAKKANKAKRGKDKYYQLAKEQGYRARSAFKLIQLNKKYDFLAKSNTLIDLCAAPGGWLQVAAKYMPSGSTIIGVDLMPIKPIRNVITHREDITTPQTRSLLKRDLAGKKCDVVLHDGAPNVGQNWQKDAYTQSELVLCSLKLATEFLKPRGLFITKVFRSADYNSLLWVFHQLFGKVEATKPHSSRNASAEIFVACRDYKAPDKIDPRLLDPRYVFKEVSENTGTSTGIAGGGGGGTVDVLHKKGHDKKVRQRDGYDETLGPLLTRMLPVASFIRSVEPVRVLTDASGLLFDDEARTLGYTAHPATSEEVVSACRDLKVLGKKEFKELLKWRVTLRRALPETLYRKRNKAAAGEGGEKAAGGSDSDSSSSDSDSDSDSDGGAGTRELSAAAATELRRRKREKKREGKARAKALRRQRLGMNLRSVDLLSTEQGLFDLTTLRKLAARADGGGDGSGDGIISDLVAEVDLDDATEGAGAAAGVGTVHARLDEGYDSEAEAAGNDSDVDMGSGGEERGGEGAEEGADSDSDDGSVLERLRSADTHARLDDLEEDMDRAYALFLAKREKRDGEARARFDSGQASAGIKLTRRAKLEQQAVMTQAALEGKLDAEHQKYLRLLAGVKASGKGFDGVATTTTLEGGASGKKRKREAAARERAAEDADDDSDLSDEDYEDEDADSSDESEGGSDGGDEGEDDEEDEDGSDDEEDGGGRSLPASASRFFSQPLFSGALGSGSGTSGASALRLAAPATTGGKAAGGKSAAAARSSVAAVEEDPFSSDADSDAQEAPRAPKGKQAQLQATKTAAAPRKGGKRPRGGAADSDEERMAVDSDGDVNPLAHIPKSDRDKWKDKLRKRRERAEAVAARRAAKDEMQIVSGIDDGGDEFAAVVQALGGAADKAPRKARKGVTFAAGEDGDSVNGDRGSDSEMLLDPREQARRDLIRRGMGAAVAPGGADASATGSGSSSKPLSKKRLLSASSGFEVVPGGGPDAEADDGELLSGGEDGEAAEEDDGPDPRDADYDSDTHAELLALGKMLKRHTTAKALVDASYNRYAFDDAETLPPWFKHDEGRHFKPQLPLAKQDVERIKAHFRDIAARPIAKVAEARARKKRKLGEKLDKAKKQAENILDQEELGARSKARAIAKAYRAAETKNKRKIVYAVHTNNSGRSLRAKGGSGGGGSVVVKHVDGRMKKERRAMKRKNKAPGGGRR